MPKMKLIITLNEQGQVNIGGPIDNRPMCYMMLESAREILTVRMIEDTFGLERSKIKKVIQMPDNPM